VIRLEEHNTLTAAQGRYTAKMDLCYINAVDAVEPHKYVNHSCNPNSRLLHWLSKDNEARLSIQVVRPVKSGDEITVDYGTIIPKSFQCTCFTCKTPLYGLAFDKGKDKDKDK
jgi:SET domain-containing protein